MNRSVTLEPVFSVNGKRIDSVAAYSRFPVWYYLERSGAARAILSGKPFPPSRFDKNETTGVEQ